MWEAAIPASDSQNLWTMPTVPETTSDSTHDASEAINSKTPAVGQRGPCNGKRLGLASTSFSRASKPLEHD